MNILVDVGNHRILCNENKCRNLWMTGSDHSTSTCPRLSTITLTNLLHARWVIEFFAIENKGPCPLLLIWFGFFEHRKYSNLVTRRKSSRCYATLNNIHLTGETRSDIPPRTTFFFRLSPFHWHNFCTEGSISLLSGGDAVWNNVYIDPESDPGTMGYSHMHNSRRIYIRIYILPIYMGYIYISIYHHIYYGISYIYIYIYIYIYRITSIRIYIGGRINTYCGYAVWIYIDHIYIYIYISIYIWYYHLYRCKLCGAWPDEN